MQSLPINSAVCPSPAAPPLPPRSFALARRAPPLPTPAPVTDPQVASTVYVTNVPDIPKLNAELKTYFSVCGPVVTVESDVDGGVAVAWIEFSDAGIAEKARGLKQIFHGRMLKVQASHNVIAKSVTSVAAQVKAAAASVAARVAAAAAATAMMTADASTEEVILPKAIGFSLQGKVKKLMAPSWVKRTHCSCIFVRAQFDFLSTETYSVCDGACTFS